MSDYKAFAKELLSLPGVSGYEKPVRECIQSNWEIFVDEVMVSPLGSLHALKKGCGKEPRPKIMIAAHMDAVGMIVTKVDGEYLRFGVVGGLDPRVLGFKKVVVHGRRPLEGVICLPAEKHLPQEWHGKSTPSEHMFIDVGIDANELAQLVRPGDLISYGNLPIELDDETLMGHTLDDRAAVVAVSVCLELLAKRKHEWDFVATATVQEELGLKGARTSGFLEMPDLAIAIDVGFAKEPGASGYFLLDPGSGPAIGWGPVCHPVLHKMLVSTAQKYNIPHTKEINPGGRTGTDGDALSLVGAGIPTAVVSIPLRFMHSPVEIVRYADLFETGRLMAELITSLDSESLQKFAISDDMEEQE